MSTQEFNTLLVAQHKPLYAFAVSLTSNRERAKDLVHDTFLKAMKYKDYFVANTNIRAWAFTIMKNIFINDYKKGKRVTSIIQQADESNKTYATYERISDKTKATDAGLMMNEIETQVSALEDALRIPFLMHYEGYKYEEISEQLEIPLGTVKSRIFMARKKLEEKLSAYKR